MSKFNYKYQKKCRLCDNKNLSSLFAFLLGSLSVISILCGLDRGAYLNLALLLLFFLLIFRGEIKKSAFFHTFRLMNF